MSIYISGIEMPSHGSITLTIRADGFVQQRKEKPDYEPPNIGEAIDVPPHGRLGDLDALHKLFLEKAKEYKGVGGAMVAMAALCITNTQTIIPAEEGE